LLLLGGAGCGSDPLPHDPIDDENPPSAPTAPGGLTATPADGAIELRWDPVAEATSYTIYWNTRGAVGTSDRALAQVSAPFVHAGLTNGTRYYYVVTASGIGGESRVSSQAAATPQAAVLTVPSSPPGVSVAPGITSVTVSWSAAYGATSYVLYWSLDAALTSGVTRLVGVNPPYVHEPLTAGTPYYYCVAALNSVGESPCSTTCPRRHLWRATSPSPPSTSSGSTSRPT
jgi:hypothetical protein